MSPSDKPSDTLRKIEVIEYDPSWPKLFELEAQLIRQSLGHNCIEIHHIGSTSIPSVYLGAYIKRAHPFCLLQQCWHHWLCTS